MPCRRGPKSHPTPARRAPKRRLSPVQRELLWILEEAGAENMLAVFNTVQPAFPDLSEEAPILTVADSIGDLRRLELVRFERMQGGEYVPIPEEESEGFLATYKERWLEIACGDWERGGGCRDPEEALLAVTDAGRLALIT